MKDKKTLPGTKETAMQTQFATPCRAGQCEENKQNRKKIKKKVDIPKDIR